MREETYVAVTPSWCAAHWTRSPQVEEAMFAVFRVSSLCTPCTRSARAFAFDFPNFSHKLHRP